jgi:hypothetical protein
LTLVWREEEKIMSLSDRPYGPTTGAANSAAQSALNVQAGGAAVLPVSQTFVAATEAKILNPFNSAVALAVPLPPDTGLEQTVFDVFISGYIKTGASGTIVLGLYADALAAVTAGNLLHKTASAVTQNSATAPFFIHATLIYDSMSGKLTGKAGEMINNVIDPEIAVSNVLTGISNLANPVLNFSLSVTSSGAAAGAAATVINIQKFNAG